MMIKMMTALNSDNRMYYQDNHDYDDNDDDAKIITGSTMTTMKFMTMMTMAQIHVVFNLQLK